ncbi:MAG: hypothetical protein KME45_01630 [Stenomitos rutilans HA7619-LM2]|jgi:hypothetical protein|nr:hypothetical protein [Stenomitos rutilans HA7619-LM2]
MPTFDDATLIQQFISGEATLAANQNLRIEPAFDSIQLLAKRGGLIASLKCAGSRRTLLVRQQSEYGTLIHQILLARHFMPTPSGDQPGFLQYRADDIPAGYELAHATARELWKEWWRTARHSGIHGIHMDLLIFARDTWYPIRNIVCSQGTLFVTTLVSEVSFTGDEWLIWLRRSPTPQTIEKTPPTTAPKLARSLQPFNRADQPTRTTLERSTPTPANFLDKPEALDSALSHPELRQVLRIRHGKLYVKTALGDIVVEGSDLKYRLEDGARASKPQKSLHFNGYREGRAVNQ